MQALIPSAFFLNKMNVNFFDIFRFIVMCLEVVYKHLLQFGLDRVTYPELKYFHWITELSAA